MIVLPSCILPLWFCSARIVSFFLCVYVRRFFVVNLCDLIFQAKPKFPLCSACYFLFVCLCCWKMETNYPSPFFRLSHFEWDFFSCLETRDEKRRFFAENKKKKKKKAKSNSTRHKIMQNARTSYTQTHTKLRRPNKRNKRRRKKKEEKRKRKWWRDAFRCKFSAEQKAKVRLLRFALKLGPLCS